MGFDYGRVFVTDEGRSVVATKPAVFDAWAIRTRYYSEPQREFLAGRYFFSEYPHQESPMRTAIFETRREARDVCRGRSSGTVSHTPVRVRVTVEARTNGDR